MDNDKSRALSFLLGRGNKTETIRTAEGVRIEAHIGHQESRAALVRILRHEAPLDGDIRNALANAFEAVGSSTMVLELNLVRRAGRGRPPHKVKQAIEELKRQNLIDQHQVVEGKSYLAIEEAGKEAKLSKSTMTRAKRNTKAAKEWRDK